MANNNHNQPKPEDNLKEEIELDETALEEVAGGAAVDYFLKLDHKAVKLLPGLQNPFVKLDPNLHK